MVGDTGTIQETGLAKDLALMGAHGGNKSLSPPGILNFCRLQMEDRQTQNSKNCMPIIIIIIGNTCTCNIHTILKTRLTKPP